jgi:hypothetical protein
MISVVVHGSQFLVVYVVARIVHVLSVPRTIWNSRTELGVCGSAQEITAICDCAEGGRDSGLTVDRVTVPQIPRFSYLHERQNIAICSINIQGHSIIIV